MRNSFLILISLIGCHHSSPTVPDAAIDAEVISDDCSTFCDKIQANCTGANAQYAGGDPTATLQSCTRTCTSFPSNTGSVSDTSGNTLGCRIHFAAAASAPASAATDCAYAGPAGNEINAASPACSGGDPCINFCTLEVKYCGSLDAPLTGDPKDSIGNSLFQYRNVADCMKSCASFDKTHPYSTTAAGDSLACRLFHATIAAISLDHATTDCSATAAAPSPACTGPATP